MISKLAQRNKLPCSEFLILPTLRLMEYVVYCLPIWLGHTRFILVVDLHCRTKHQMTPIACLLHCGI